MYAIYIHRLKRDGRVYVGQTSSIKDRWACKGIKYKACRHIWNAFQKYGCDSFDHIVLYEGLSKQEADAYEMLLVSKYDSRNPAKGFNLRGGGQRGSVSEETRKRMSAAQSGPKHPNYGRKLPEEHRRHIREANTGEKNGFYGKHHTEETKRLLREKRALQVNTFKGGHHTEESKQRMREAKLSKAKTVVCVETSRAYVGIKEAGRKTGIDKTSISRCCRGIQDTAGGFHWRFA